MFLASGRDGVCLAVRGSLDWARRGLSFSPSSAAQRRAAGLGEVLSVMGEKGQERRGPSGSVLQNQRTAKSPRPGTLVLVRGAPFRGGAKGFTNGLRCGFTADNQQLRSRPRLRPSTPMSELPPSRALARKPVECHVTNTLLPA